MTLFRPDTALVLGLGVLCFFFSVVWGRPLIRILRHMQIGEAIRVDGPKHMSKVGTPTMGGLMIIIPTVIFCSIFILPYYHSLLLPLGMLVVSGVLGALDDIAKQRQKRAGKPKEGILGRYKLLWQAGVAIVTGLILYYPLDMGKVALPGFDSLITLPLLLYIPAVFIIQAGTSNGVNLADGLDGLAGGTAAISFASFGVIALRQGNVHLAAFCFCVGGGTLAFLWYNAYPAKLFMGDTGSLALGAALSIVALMTLQWPLLPIVGVIFLAQALSTMIQTLYFKLTRRLTGTGKRFFKMAPIHHHFELEGWSEVQIVQRFWIIAMLAGMFGIALAML